MPTTVALCQVSLDIIKALIEACYRDLSLFSKYVVRILNMFVVFANYHDGSTVGVNSEFTVDYERLVQKFATFYDPSDNDDQKKLPSKLSKRKRKENMDIDILRYIGQRAMHAAVTSPALYASDFATQVELIMPPLITALANIGHPVDPTKSGPAPTNVHTWILDKNTVDLLAPNKFVLMSNKANGSAVRATLKPLFTFFDTNQKWWPSSLATSSMELAFDSLKIHRSYNRFIAKGYYPFAIFLLTLIHLFLFSYPVVMDANDIDDQDLITMKLPIDYLPGLDKPTKMVLKHATVVDFIANTLLNAPPRTYTVTDADWNNMRSDIVYLPRLETSGLPPILIEIQNTLNGVFLLSDFVLA
ncbi:hypothetical protein F4703DRAFT_1797197 [Phycomyces blakesleeanus]